jgi:hypothetical protein
MSVEKTQQAIDLVRSYPDRGFFKGQIKESVIDEAEKILSVKMPPSYRLFLRELGAGSFNGKEFYGITKESNMHEGSVPNGIWYTLEERSTGNLPDQMIVVGANDFNELYAIDARKQTDELESPVVIWIPGLSQHTDLLNICARSFGEYFLTEVSNS